ncbi:hypothetical protein AAVH_25445, partial [Aphelenchoides avenae]
ITATKAASELTRQLTKEIAERTAVQKKLAATSAQERSLRDKLAKEHAKYAQLEASSQAEHTEFYDDYLDACAKSQKLESDLRDQRQKCNKLEGELKDNRKKIVPKQTTLSCDCHYESERNFDFRAISMCLTLVDAGKSFVRGGVPYIRPVGSMRYALAVYERYDDKEWLNDDDSGWPVAYHGTTRESAAAIISYGFGRGIYCTPDPATAKAYASPCTDSNKRWKFVLQVRVKPGAYAVAKLTDSNDGEYWLVTHPAYIRPYAVCAYEV